MSTARMSEKSRVSPIRVGVAEPILHSPSRKIHLPNFNLGYFGFTTLDRFQNFPIHNSYYVAIADKNIVRAPSAKDNRSLVPFQDANEVSSLCGQRPQADVSSFSMKTPHIVS